ncbi:MAG: AAA family ATPase, partial [Leptospiraceae bacterium]|nr:AAA family ATPase [Leptospiraceae bacterium]
MITISVANQKGGEGKTTTSINLAEGLSRRGFKTILLDIDPQGNSSSIYCNTDEIESSMYHLFHKKLKLQNILFETKKENLYLAPSNTKLAEMEVLSSNTVEAPFILRDAMEGSEKF